jgi:hypothetical protein
VNIHSWSSVVPASQLLQAKVTVRSPTHDFDNERWCADTNVVPVPDEDQMAKDFVSSVLYFI